MSARLFFLAATVCAAVVGAVWVPWFLGLWRVPTELSLNVWFTHELLFGAALAALAGMLCRQRELHRWALPALLTLWLIARAAAALLSEDSFLFVAVPGVACSVVLLAFGGKHWRAALPVLGLLIAQLLFLWEVLRFGRSAYGGWLGVSVLLLWCGLRFGTRGFWSALLGGVLLIGTDAAFGPQRYSAPLMQAWMAGAIGMIVLAPLTCGHSTGAVARLCVVVAVLARVGIAMSPGWTMVLVPLSGVSWIAAFLIGSVLAVRQTDSGVSPKIQP